MASRVNLLHALAIVVHLVGVRILGEPIKFTTHTFENCRPSVILGEVVHCCLPRELIKGPVEDFVPRRDLSKPLRVRKALQCLEGAELEEYTEKLHRGYALMRALPDDDPRSLRNLNRMHCSYGSMNLLQDATNLGTDVHASWFFYPWHRFFVFFHERILQTLLGDLEFSLHFWNYDNSITVDPPPRDGCFKAGHFFPPMYQDPSRATFSPDRLPIASDPGAIVDLVTPVQIGPLEDAYPRLADEEIIANNRAALHASMITSPKTAEDFLGRNYSVGDECGMFPVTSGSFEIYHAGVHMWVGKGMKPVTTSAFDPIFYAHHSNVDRIWTLWEGLRSGRSYPRDDPDWMEAEFLLFDERGVMRRVKVKDSLDTEALGYVYQRANDESWILPPNSPLQKR